MLRVHEIFYSLQGEARSSGRPSVFIRLTGCPLRCHWCDTAYAFSGGQLWSIEAILEKAASYSTRWVCVTGGEPLAQPECRPLLCHLLDAGYEVSLETSGALAIQGLDPRLSIVMDLKAPDSGEASRNLLTNVAHLKPTDQIKIVIASRADFDWACQQADTLDLFKRVDEVLISPVWQSIAPAELAQWVLDSQRPWRFQLQLHKILWNDTPGR